MKAMRYTLEQLNTMAPSAFVAALSGIFEHSPWVAEVAAGERPFASIDALHKTMSGAVETAGEVRQFRVSVDERELSGAGLDQCTQEEFDKLLTLNRTYREKFGFPFILAVRGYDRHGIIANFESRVNHSRTEELRASLDQIYRIARFRLDDLIDA